MTEGQQRRLKAARWLARSMDTRWHLGPLRFGAEALFNLIPVAGQLGSLAVSLYQFVLAVDLMLPRGKLIQMLFNMAVDEFAGSLPFVGDLIDVTFRVHARNQRIIDRHLEQSRISA